jgi:hypothetical protein
MGSLVTKKVIGVPPGIPCCATATEGAKPDKARIAVRTKDVFMRRKFSLGGRVVKFFGVKLDNMSKTAQIGSVGTQTKTPGARQIAPWVRQRIETGGERLWRYDDFPGAPVAAVAQALSRLAREGTIQRLSKGVYYIARQTALGRSLPNPALMRRLASKRTTVFASGIAAANLLGFTTQASSRSEVATSATSLPRKLVGGDTLVHTRRPEAWAMLTESEAALLDFLRRSGKTGELSGEDTTRRTLQLLGEPGRYERLLKVTPTEPPRVRAMIGAIGEALGKKPATLERLRESLNPLSRFDFGMLSVLPSAGRWQAKGRRPA